MAKISEMRAMEVAALEEKLIELRTELARERAQIASGTRAEKPAKIRNIRRGIARVLTLMNEKKRRGGK